MNKIHRTWKRLRIHERVAMIVTVGVVVAMFVLCILSLAKLLTLQIELVVILMSLLMAAQTVQQWRKNRKPALYCLATALVLVLFAFFVHFAM